MGKDDGNAKRVIRLTDNDPDQETLYQGSIEKKPGFDDDEPA
ncbi:MAG: hypothetical protein OXU25_00110 [Thaumarchaeota archaeon]|nr:hypothetical protein [Nitrososphaerota archaeon]